VLVAAPSPSICRYTSWWSFYSLQGRGCVTPLIASVPPLYALSKAPGDVRRVLTVLIEFVVCFLSFLLLLAVMLCSCEHVLSIAALRGVPALPL
jgi:hypothetical protein